MKIKSLLLLISLLVSVALSACQSSKGSSAEREVTTEAKQDAKVPDYYQSGMEFTPEASGEKTEENEDVIYDISHVDQ